MRSLLRTLRLSYIVMAPAIGLAVAVSPWMDGQPHPLAVLLWTVAAVALGAVVIWTLDRIVEAMEGRGRRW